MPQVTFFPSAPPGPTPGRFYPIRPTAVTVLSWEGRRHILNFRHWLDRSQHCSICTSCSIESKLYQRPTCRPGRQGDLRHRKYGVMLEEMFGSNDNLSRALSAGRRALLQEQVDKSWEIVYPTVEASVYMSQPRDSKNAISHKPTNMLSPRPRTTSPGQSQTSFPLEL
ncbi:uncharacterized protein CLUP02_06139 [Colletotrichum lupini]|uniref:Uncharacterized protein n=1 Tax=Colletotrichum lupini TaxID=145971 RepID=A0A9Q8SNV5_9PEZI|nr:uncharacterized protein CLUP02_06139 [Colletotrichum lupini]UQC80655.1 hypothetical protein CLUP02_06139 [Colletotrichum lupini]